MFIIVDENMQVKPGTAEQSESRGMGLKSGERKRNGGLRDFSPEKVTALLEARKWLFSKPCPHVHPMLLAINSSLKVLVQMKQTT